MVHKRRKSNYHTYNDVLDLNTSQRYSAIFLPKVPITNLKENLLRICLDLVLTEAKPNASILLIGGEKYEEKYSKTLMLVVSSLLVTEQTVIFQGRNLESY